MITFEEVKSNPAIAQLIKRTSEFLDAQGFTDHGTRHLNIVSQRAEMLASKIGIDKRVGEYAKIAGWTHDMANFLSRSNHHYFGAIMFFDLYKNHEDIEGVTLVMEAIANHDKAEAEIANPITALLIIADKSDVARDRVRTKDMKEIKSDIHDRVNYAVTDSNLKVENHGKNVITLELTIDTNFTSIMDYFEIFIERMKYCKTASSYLGYEFKIVVNGVKVG